MSDETGNRSTLSRERETVNQESSARFKIQFVMRKYVFNGHHLYTMSVALHDVAQYFFQDG